MIPNETTACIVPQGYDEVLVCWLQVLTFWAANTGHGKWYTHYTAHCAVYKIQKHCDLSQKWKIANTYMDLLFDRGMGPSTGEGRGGVWCWWHICRGVHAHSTERKKSPACLECRLATSSWKQHRPIRAGGWPKPIPGRNVFFLDKFMYSLMLHAGIQVESWQRAPFIFTVIQRALTIHTCATAL